MARGKGKRGGGRGGGARFAAESADEIEVRNKRLAAFDAERAARRAGSDEEGEEGEGGEEGENEGGDNNEGGEAEEVGERVARMSTGNREEDAAAELFEQERMAKKKGPDLGETFVTANPNAVKQSFGTKLKDMNSAAAAPLSRKDREEKEKADAAERYRKRHEAGLTDEYKKDMAKLNEVKARRAVQAEQAEERKAVEDEKRAKVEAQKEKQVAKSVNTGKADDGSIPKLDKIAIKKMKPAVMKEALQARGLEIQGNAKVLMKRLVDYEAER